MLPRQDFGWHHQGTLGAALNRRGQRQQCDDRLAGADIALQQPQHAIGRCHVFEDFANNNRLRVGEAIGQGVDELAAQFAGSRKPAPHRAFHIGPHQRQRQLIGQQFVIGQPPPGM